MDLSQNTTSENEDGFRKLWKCIDQNMKKILLWKGLISPCHHIQPQKKISTNRKRTTNKRTLKRSYSSVTSDYRHKKFGHYFLEKTLSVSCVVYDGVFYGFRAIVRKEIFVKTL